ncbi:uncharacterized protein LOC102082990 [Oreochromis niloticus]|uniref:Uncharacterized LOC102082990 n=1 Tax=Oreochromis niloticus TaxID=8128 RepID=A0A669BQG0_ORENI|nr:uncharacterized protein LOC102082990 [Oreochromis niloticus]XP_019213555.1 uncharacterized protein LOC102082990 [Oreochromis niloticus]XP_019213556.1 uncharacterized protein LOC102082990 [Oreochromis niloticus]
MLKISGQISCCVALLLTLTSVSAVRRALNSISDLKTVGFGQSVPEYSLRLLHWFANEIDINNNDDILLTFDPNRGDYGSHQYRNDEELLDPLPRGYRYYTVGNIYQDASLELPDYVVEWDIEESNRVRIIIRVRQQNAVRTIDQVYITQHYETHEDRGTEYDPQHTYPVTVCLLRAIRKFSLDRNNITSMRSLRDHFGSSADDSQLWDIMDIWDDLACLGLFLFIVIPEKYTSHKHNSRRQPAPRRNTQPDFVINIPESRQNVTSGTSAKNQVDHRNGITLKVTTGKSGHARILWSNVHSDLLKQDVLVALYQNNQEEKALTFICIGNIVSGSYDTSVPLNEGLQVRLHEVRRTIFFLWTSVGKEIDRGSEFKNPNAVNITGYNANLQLFAKDGKACARLTVTKSFQDWRSKFKNAWVGFYSSESKGTNNYEWWRWQWATKFKENNSQDNYNVYEYESGMTIAPGVQARFILQDEIEKARTSPWGE